MPTRDVLTKIEKSVVKTDGQDILSSYTPNVNAIGQRKTDTTASTAFPGVQANWAFDYDSLGQLIMG